MKIIEGNFGSPKEAEGPPDPEEVWATFAEAAEMLDIDEVMIIGRSSTTGALSVLANQSLVDQNFLLDAAKQCMFQSLISED